MLSLKEWVGFGPVDRTFQVRAHLEQGMYVWWLVKDCQTTIYMEVVFSEIEGNEVQVYGEEKIVEDFKNQQEDAVEIRNH